MKNGSGVFEVEKFVFDIIFMIRVIVEKCKNRNDHRKTIVYLAVNDNDPLIETVERHETFHAEFYSYSPLFSQLPSIYRQRIILLAIVCNSAASLASFRAQSNHNRKNLPNR